MTDLAGWVALVATCLAALMTASNLGARITGWGLIIFTVGAAAWVVVGVVTHQVQLLYSNLFLGLVDMYGVWRWLGRRARMSDTSRAEERRSDKNARESVFSTAQLDGLPVRSGNGDVLATTVDALADCAGGRISFLIVRAGGVGGIGETLYRMPWSEASVGEGEIRTRLSEQAFRQLPIATPG